jgi:AcrR family transcriptional regulator
MPTRTKTRRDVRWVGLSPDARKAERRTLLLDATFDLLGTEGAEATTVRAVCLKARLNPRYFYESFDDLDTLVVAVYDRVVERRQRVALEDGHPVTGAPERHRGAESTDASTHHHDVLVHPDPPWQRSLPSP